MTYYSTPGGEVALHCADSRTLPDLRADLIVTDPPYEETSLGWDRWPGGWLDWAAAVAPSLWCFLPMRQFAMPPFRGREFAAAGWKLSHDVVWEKHNGSSFGGRDRFKRVHEPATHWYRGAWSGIYHQPPRVPRTGPAKTVKARTSMAHTGRIAAGGYIDDGTRLHRSVIAARNMHGKAIAPTQKPVELLTPLIEYGCPPGGTVVDPFAGSGATGVAALWSGRRAVLIEGDEGQCEKSARWLAAEYARWCEGRAA